MKVSRRQRLPLVPLLQTYLSAGIAGSEEFGKLPGLGARFRAVLAARSEFLNEAFLDSASEQGFQDTLVGFYEQCVPLPLHRETLRRRAAIVRHGLIDEELQFIEKPFTADALARKVRTVLDTKAG